jgi:hypothetical protein
MRLGDCTKLLRSKNAGPFMLTMDLLFHDMASYDRARHCGLLEPARVAALYGVDPVLIKVFLVPDVLAIKISFPRPIASGGERDNDVYGCQYMARLARLPMPDAA